jgi:ankyrin repeat protein
MLELLLQNGANPNVLNDLTGMAPIHYIGGSSNINNDTVKLLIDYGADINILAKEPNTPPPYTINSTAPESLRFLLEEHAEFVFNNIKNNEGKTPLDIAIERNYQDNIEILRKYGAKTSEELKN